MGLIAFVLLGLSVFLIGCVAGSILMAQAACEKTAAPTAPKSPPQWEIGPWVTANCCPECNQPIGNDKVWCCPKCGHQTSKTAMFAPIQRVFRIKKLGDHSEAEWREEDAEV